MTDRLVIATHNPGKLREFRRLLGDIPFVLASLDEVGVETEIEETGTSFEENALLKARGYAAACGEMTLADDSGLEVDALDGEPGIMSARYSGPGQSDADRTRRLLERMAGVPNGQRAARYRAVLALAWPPGANTEPLIVEGVCEGEIARFPRGSNGFGYDPVFWLPQYGRTMAELTPQEKDAISHRGAAARAMRRALLQPGRGAER